MGRILGLMRMWITSMGCSSCIAPVKIHLIKTRGVLGVHVVGSQVIVIYDPGETTPNDIIRESGIKEYYKIHKYVLEDIEEEELRKHFKTVHGKYSIH